MARRDDIQIDAVDGRPIGARRYEPSLPAAAQVVIHGATAVPQRFYDAFASHVASRGSRVITYDYRGIGRSRSLLLRDDPVTMQDWIDDASVVQRWTKDLDPDLPLVAIGHSFGGQIAPGLAPAADAIVAIAAQGGYVGRFPSPHSHGLRVLMSVGIPAFATLLGYVPGWAGLGEDLPPGVAKQWARWCLHPEYYFSELVDMRAKVAAWDGPMLALSFTDDDYASLENVEWLLERFERAQIDHHRFTPAAIDRLEIGHFGFFREKIGAAMWTVVDDFLHERVGIAPPPPVRARSFADEIMADLSYGRV